MGNIQKMKRVLHLRSSGGKLGAETVIIELCKHSMDNGFEPVVGALKNDADPEPEFLKDVTALNTQSVVFSGSRSFDVKLISQIRKFIKKEQIDIVHAHGYKEDFYGLFSTLNSGKCRVATNHLWKDIDWKEKVYRVLDQTLLKFYDRVVGVSAEIENLMNQKGIRKTLKIDNGIDTELYRFQPKNEQITEKLGIENELVFGMVSSLTEEKGHLIAIEALDKVSEQFKDFKCLIAGDGPFRDEIEKAIKQRQLENNVILLGRRSDVLDILSVIDIYFLSSYIEGLPMSLLEAMASEKAVITTGVGEIPHMIYHGENGIMIPAGNADVFAKEILNLVDDTSKIRSLGRNARKTVVQKYSSVQMTKKYCDLYQQILMEK